MKTSFLVYGCIAAFFLYTAGRVFPIAEIENLNSKSSILPEGIPAVVLLRPTGDAKEDLPVFRKYSENTANKRVVEKLFETTFMKSAVRLYFLAQNYLNSQGILTEHEPAYLLLSNHAGGYARRDFYLKSEGGLLDKTGVWYVDYVKNDDEEEDHSGSMTQIYPHEMGHVIYHMLCGNLDEHLPAAVDVHFVSITTDFRMAFNEGFAEHFENISVENETDEVYKNNILSDLKRQKKSIKNDRRGYHRDFVYPLRLGYYRMTMLFWYQKFEDIKRHEWTVNGNIRFKNASIRSRNIEKALFYRNSGVMQDRSESRNLQQALATEGVISAFFTQLVSSDLKHNYLKKDFYRGFVLNAADSGEMEHVLTPLENQYVKIFHVLNTHVDAGKGDRPQLNAFVSGYVKEFPDEKDAVYEIYRFATGFHFTEDVGPELWVMNQDYDHGILVMDQFGGITLPVYTFNINACDVIDLLTFKGISREQAGLIVDYRDKNRYIETFDEISNIPGIEKKTASILKSNLYDTETIEYVLGEDILKIEKIFTATLRHLLWVGFLVFVLLSIVSYALFLRKQKLSPGQWIKNILGNLTRVYFTVIAGLICVVFSENPIVVFLAASIVLVGIESAVKRKNRFKMQKAVFSSLVVVLIVAYSLF